MKTGLKLAILICAFGLMNNVYAFGLPEDLLSKSYWDNLDAKTKPVFLMGYRHGVGLISGNPEPKSRSLALRAKDFPKIIEKLDTFYSNKENEHVHIRLAIHIALMEMTGKPKAEIDALLKKSHQGLCTGF